MLLKFFEALSDRNARVAVEFTKKPRNMDEAVDCVIQYKEIRKANRTDDGGKFSHARATRSADGFSFWDESYENDSEGADIRAAKADDNSGIEPPMKKLKKDPDGEVQSSNNQMESLVASSDGKVDNSSQVVVKGGHVRQKLTKRAIDATS